jgi:hypothetical protein
MSLFDLLLATRGTQCSNPRDKVYGLLGLAWDWWQRKGVKIDYGQSVEDVYRGYARWDIRFNSLRILSCVTDPDSRTKDLPSWTPDWIDGEYNPFPFVRYGKSTKFRAVANLVPWNRVHYSENCRVLHALGKPVDVIRKIGSKPEFIQLTSIFKLDASAIEKLMRTHAWLRECQDIACIKTTKPESTKHTTVLKHDGSTRKKPRRMPARVPERQGSASISTYSLSEDRFDAFWKAMICSLTENAEPAPSDYAPSFVNYLHFFATAPSRFKNFLEEASRAPEGILGMRELCPEVDSYKQIEASLHKWASHRRFCATASDRFAMVPKWAKEGDVITVLHGSNVPIVLRECTGGYHQVVGEAYVHGIMHGEGLRVAAVTHEFRLK